MACLKVKCSSVSFPAMALSDGQLAAPDHSTARNSAPVSTFRTEELAGPPCNEPLPRFHALCCMWLRSDYQTQQISRCKASVSADGRCLHVFLHCTKSSGDVAACKGSCVPSHRTKRRPVHLLSHAAARKPQASMMMHCSSIHCIKLVVMTTPRGAAVTSRSVVNQALELATAHQATMHMTKAHVAILQRVHFVQAVCLAYKLQVRRICKLGPSPCAAAAVCWCHCTTRRQQAWRQRHGSIRYGLL